METLSIGFFKSILTEDELDVATSICCEFVDPEGGFTIDTVYREFIDTSYFIKCIEDPENRMNEFYDRNLLDSIAKKLRDNYCDLYTIFSEGRTEKIVFGIIDDLESIEIEDILEKTPEDNILDNYGFMYHIVPKSLLGYDEYEYYLITLQDD